MDLKKLYWINGEHIKITPNEKLAELVKPRLALRDIYDTAKPALEDVLALVKDRAQDLNTLADECLYFYVKQTPAEADVQKHWDDEAAARMLRFAERLEGLEDWTAEAIHDLFKPFCDEEGIKMGKLGMPLRLAVCGTAKTPSVDAVLALIGKEEVLKRIRS